MKIRELLNFKSSFNSLIPDPAAGSRRSCWSRLLDLLFPPLCHSCRAFLPDPGDVNLCSTCLAGTIPIVSPICTCCGRPFATVDGGDHLCGACITDPPPFLVARAVLAYSGTTRELIHRFKYGHKVMLRRPLGYLGGPCIDQFVRGFGADLLVPVPLHRKRVRERGFNQAILLGEIYSRRWGIPLVRNNLRRIRWTEPQINLTASARAENVRGAFALADAAAVAGKKVLLVDDVYTTGSTVKECARVLGKGGAAAVAVLTVARAIE